MTNDLRKTGTYFLLTGATFIAQSFFIWLTKLLAGTMKIQFDIEMIIPFFLVIVGVFFIIQSKEYKICLRFNYINMPIIINLDVVLAKRKMRSKELAELIGITTSNLSILKSGKAKAIRFSTLEEICKVLDCQPADLLEYVEDKV